ncbi:MAG: hypothetical protein AB7D20_11860 [Sulfuricurvum sp.]|jgi:hypothetical protein|uniref:hypothetical protein n=1 Tax=Sulfuricurvum sp. TaxID=2025608 RepID=UPI003D0FF4D4
MAVLLVAISPAWPTSTKVNDPFQLKEIDLAGHVYQIPDKYIFDFNPDISDKELTGISLRISWPTLNPCDSEGIGNGSCIKVALVRFMPPKINMERKDWSYDAPFWPRIKSKIKRLSSGWWMSDEWDRNKKVYKPLHGVGYVEKGLDKETGLYWAIPEGKGSEDYHVWNYSLYWENKGGRVSTLIECQNGRFKGVDRSRVCSETFIVSSLNIEIIAFYDKSNLGDWKAIRNGLEGLISGFVVK